MSKETKRLIPRAVNAWILELLDLTLFCKKLRPIVSFSNSGNSGCHPWSSESKDNLSHFFCDDLYTVYIYNIYIISNSVHFYQAKTETTWLQTFSPLQGVMHRPGVCAQSYQSQLLRCSLCSGRSFSHDLNVYHFRQVTCDQSLAQLRWAAAAPHSLVPVKSGAAAQCSGELWSNRLIAVMTQHSPTNKYKACSNAVMSFGAISMAHSELKQSYVRLDLTELL